MLLNFRHGLCNGFRYVRGRPSFLMILRIKFLQPPRWRQTSKGCFQFAESAWLPFETRFSELPELLVGPLSPSKRLAQIPYHWAPPASVGAFTSAAASGFFAAGACWESTTGCSGASCSSASGGTPAGSAVGISALDSPSS